jgi:hypothetical protein
MKYTLLLALILLINLSLYGQSKWTFGVIAGPNITATIPFTNQPKYKQTPQLGGEFGVNVYKKLTKSLYFQSGLTIAHRRLKEEYDSSRFIVNEKESYYFTEYHQVKNTDLNLPLCLNFRFRLNDKLSISSIAGVTLGWHLKEIRKITSQYINNNNINSYNSKGIDMVYVTLGLGVLYKIDDKFSLMIVPNFMADAKSEGFYSTPASFDLRATLLYTFTKK